MAHLRHRAVSRLTTLAAVVGLIVALTACDPTTYTLSLASSTPGPVPAGSQVTFSGKVSPARSGGTVEIQRSVDGSWTKAGSTTLSSSSRYSVKLKLSQLGTYKLRARWSGPNGATAISSSVSITTTSLPSAPASVSAQRDDSDAATGGRVRVSWAAGAPGATALRKYTVVISGGPGASSRVLSAAQRELVVTGLSNGTPYSFAVYATNASGDGPKASASATPARVPGTPDGLTAAAGDTEAPLTFGAPDDGGDPISRYELASSQGTVGLRQGSGGRAATGLTNGTTYTFQIRACNGVGCGAWSSSSNAVTPYGNPAAPSISASVAGNAVTWSWNVPSGNGRPIDHYEVTLDGALVDGNRTGTSFSKSFGPGEAHTLSVVAVNTAGRKGPAGSRSATTADSRSVSVSMGAPVTDPGCSGAPCARVVVNLTGFGSGSHTVVCMGDYGGTAEFYRYTTTSTTSSACYFGYPGYHVWVVVDGVESNHITW